MTSFEKIPVCIQIYELDNPQFKWSSALIGIQSLFEIVANSKGKILKTGDTFSYESKTYKVIDTALSFKAEYSEHYPNMLDIKLTVKEI